MTLSQPIVPHSLVEEAFERLADAIAGGEIGAGERIREAVLAQQLGVSRAVLREALQRLESLRLVTRTPNVGVHVIRPTSEDLHELYTMMEAMEGLAARLAAYHMPRDEIVALQSLLEQDAHRPPSERLPPLVDGEAFHSSIARGSRHARLERMVCGELRYQLRFYSRHIRVRMGWWSIAASERRDVVRAIEAGDSERAEEAMRAHVRRWSHYLTLDEAGDASR